MKYLFVTLLCFTIIKSFSQSTTIHFTIENDQIKADQDLSKLKLPIDLSFNSENFKGRTVEILDESDKVIALNNRQFGQSELQAISGEAEINIQILENGTVNPPTQGDNTLKGRKKIKLKIDSKTPVILTFDESTKLNTPEEEYLTGYIYYDVIALRSTKDIGTIKKILATYGVNSSNYMNNPYLRDIFGNVFQKGGDQAGGKLLTNLGNTDITYFAAGMARFLAERTKDELNEAFFCKMKEQLNAYPELKTIFPKTASFLNQIETFSYISILNALKDAFEMDIQNLPENLYNIKDLTSIDCNREAICDKDKDCKNFIKCQERIDKLSEFFESQDGQWVKLGMYTVKEAVESTNPADLLNAISYSTELDMLKSSSVSIGEYDDYNIASSIELMNLISQSLISKSDTQVWITKAQLNSLLCSKTALKIYTGLLLAKEQSAEPKTIIRFYNTDQNQITFGDILIKAYHDYDNYEPQIRNLIKESYSAYNAANNAVSKMKSAIDKNVDVDPQSLYNYYRTFTSALKPIALSPMLKAITGKDISAGYSKVELYLNPSVDLAYHLSTKKYSAAIYDASILLSSLNNVVDEKKKPVFEPVTKSFVKYGTLISTVAGAQSSDEVKQAIEASVLPVGSSSIKRNSSWSIALNAYVGGYWSYKNTTIENDSVPTFGLMAPIGINFSKGFSKNGKWGGLSANIQFIELGALVNYYMIKGDTASLPNDFSVKLSNIFSPGFNLCCNIPKTPLSLAWGGQYIPTLYKYEQINGKNELTPTDAWRWHVSLLIDIPLYNIKVWDFKK